MIPTPTPVALPEAVSRALCAPQRFPVLSPAGRRMLHWLRGHPHAPRYRDYSGHRLDRWALWQARWRHHRLVSSPWQHPVPHELPVWVLPFSRAVRQSVPFHGQRGLHAAPWHEIPTTGRADLSADLTAHLPCAWSSRPERWSALICFTTSGTTGHPLRVPSLPRVAADYQAYHRRALAQLGLTPRAGRGQVGVALVGHQQRCFTYVSVNPLQGECGLVKLNLMPHEWHDPDDRARYLDALSPELISGDPVSLAALAALPMAHRPLALLSTSMALTPALRDALQARFACPVLDVYSLNEVGPVAVFDPALDGFVPLQPRLHIELLDDDGRPVAPGALGEVTVTGGFNPCLPLLRYRTGDHARWGHGPGGPVLRDLQGRAPVRFRHAAGHWVNNVELTQAFKPLPVVRFALHQAADDRLHLQVDMTELRLWQPRLRAAVQGCLGELPLRITPLQADDKVRQYTRDAP
ncbi:MAG: capsule biosynthesis protein CapK [Pseudomonadota bacterium]